MIEKFIPKPQILNDIEISPKIIVANPQDPIPNITLLPSKDQDWGMSTYALDFDIDGISSQIPEESQMPYEYIFENHLGGGNQQISSAITATPHDTKL